MKALALLTIVAVFSFVVFVKQPVLADVIETPSKPDATVDPGNIHGEATLVESTSNTTTHPSTPEPIGTIPEPASALLAGLGLLVAGMVRRRAA